jgi:hypothetical protein
VWWIAKTNPPGTRLPTGKFGARGPKVKPRTASGETRARANAHSADGLEGVLKATLSISEIKNP